MDGNGRVLTSRYAQINQSSSKRPGAVTENAVVARNRRSFRAVGKLHLILLSPILDVVLVEPRPWHSTLAEWMILCTLSPGNNG